MRAPSSRSTAVVTTALALALLTAGCGSTPTNTASDATSPASSTSPDSSAGSGGGSQAKVPAELEFTTTTVDGTTFEGSSLAGKDAVLWFWAPWCTVCRGEAPTIAKSAEKWGDKVTFVGVPGRGETGEMKRFISDTGLDGMPQAVDTDGSLWARFGVTAQPAVAFVNDDGEVRVYPGAFGATQFDDEVERLTLR